MLSKAINRLSVILTIAFLVFIFIALNIKQPIRRCEPRNTFENYPSGRTAVIHLCIDQRNSPLSVSVREGDFVPIAIRGHLSGVPIWSQNEHIFAFSVRTNWGGSLIFTYFLYDLETGKIIFLLRSPKSYGIVWRDDHTLIFIRMDEVMLCYHYYVVDNKRLVEVRASHLTNVQCMVDTCVRFTYDSDRCLKTP